MTKQEYFAELRANRQKAKEYAEKMSDDVAKQFEIAKGINPNLSVYGFCFMKMEMEKQGIEGIPGIDVLTFNKRKEQGFIAKEKSTLRGITRITAKNKKANGDDDGFKFPKSYAVFHRSQVVAM